MTAGTTGYTPEFIRKNEEIMTNSLLYDLVNQMYLNTDRQDEAPKDKIFEAECQVVRNLAKKGNCVIVGRCADYVLRNYGNCLKVFSRRLLRAESKEWHRDRISPREKPKLRFRKMKSSVQIIIAITPAVCGVQPETLTSA